MPQAIPVLIAVGIGAGTAALVGSSILLGAALAGGAALVSILTAPDVPDLGSLGDNAKKTIRSASEPARWAFGRVRVGGLITLVDEGRVSFGGNAAGTLNRLRLYIAVCDGRMQMGIDTDDGVFCGWVNGEQMYFRVGGVTPVTSSSSNTGNQWNQNYNNLPYYLYSIGEYQRMDSYQNSYSYIRLRPSLGSSTLYVGYEGRTAWIWVDLFDPRDYAGADFWRGVPELNFLIDALPYSSLTGFNSELNSAGLHGNGGIPYFNVVGYGIEQNSFSASNTYGGTFHIQNFPGTGWPDYDFTASGGVAGYANVALVYLWWLTERRGIPSAAIDYDSVVTAIGVCQEKIQHTVLADYPAEYTTLLPRYACAGVVYADDDPERVEAELDFAWQGTAVEADGKYYFRPGVDRPITQLLTPDDMLEAGVVAPGPSVQERFNAVTMSLNQSLEHEFLEFDMPVVRDDDAVMRDGELLLQDLGRRAFVHSPLIAGSLMAKQLRRARATLVITYHVGPGAGMRWLSVLPTDVVGVTDPEHGLENFRMAIEQVTVEPDWSVVLQLRESPLGLYDDSTVLSALALRNIDIPDSLLPHD